MIANGRLYTVISYEHENNYIMWEKDGMWLEIKGMETINTLVKIAESME